jgi:opacity protein-like surface antigen
MRRFIVALALAGIAGSAFAGEFELPDVPVLRGSNPALPSPYIPAPPVFTRWSGFYGGVQAGYSRAGVDFSQVVGPLVNQILRDSAIQQNVGSWSILSNGDTNSYNAGGFAGFNTQWDEAVLGFEMNYAHTNLLRADSDSLSLMFINNAQAPTGHTYQYAITVSGASSVQVTDIWTARLRGGWVVDCWLPYAFAGGAVARANVFRSAAVSGTLTDIHTDASGNEISTTSTLALPAPITEGQNNYIAFGYTLGVGVDYMLLPNVIARAEYEFVQMPNVKGAKLSINTLRTGVGLKF